MLRRNNPKQAYQAATAAAKRNPFSARNFYLGGKALKALGRLDDAVRWLERSTQLDQTYPEPLYLLGRVYLEQGQREKGKAMMERFQEVKAKAPRQRR